MGLIPNEIISAVLERSEIVSVVGRYVALKKAGRNYKALCPFHSEKSPSFVVNPDKQIYHCFGCGEGGNAIGFVMKQERLEFPQAVRLLADQCGITVPDDGPAESGPSKQLKDDIYRVNEMATGYFHDLLLSSRDAAANKAREYLKNRGVSLDIVKQFRIGFAADEWDGLIRFLGSKGINSTLMEQAGLVIAREGKSGHYDRFRNRVIFPIADIQSRPVAFGARALSETEGAKYINSPETAVYTKGRHLYGLNLTKTATGKLDQAIVVEGYMDMIMPFCHTVENIMASLGTALTVEQIRLIRRYTTNVVMLFDTDPAGQNAIIRSLDLLVEEGMNVRVVTLAKDEDPDSFIRSFGVEAFRRRLDSAQSLFDFKLAWLKAQYPVTTTEGRSKVCRQMMSTIGRYKDEVVKYELTRALSVQFDIPIEVLSQLTDAPKAIVPKQQAAVVKTAPLSSRSHEMLLALLLSDPQWAAQARSLISPEDFPPGTAREVAERLWAVSDGNETWTVNDVLTGLPQTTQSQALVSRLVTQDEGFLQEPQRAFDDCIARILEGRRRQERQQLIEAIRHAEASGNEEKVGQLREQFNQMMRKT